MKIDLSDKNEIDYIILAKLSIEDAENKINIQVKNNDFGIKNFTKKAKRKEAKLLYIEYFYIENILVNSTYLFNGLTIPEDEIYLEKRNSNYKLNNLMLKKSETYPPIYDEDILENMKKYENENYDLYPEKENNEEELNSRLLDKINFKIEQDLYESLFPLEKFNSRKLKLDSKIENYSPVKKIIFPIYFMTYEYKNREYLFKINALNGRTYDKGASSNSKKIVFMIFILFLSALLFIFYIISFPFRFLIGIFIGKSELKERES